jgi:enoyl-[acyl-carrier-protein] reductase (NADH)
MNDGGSALAIGGDVCDPDATQRALSEVQEQLGPVLGLVNNAGVRADGLAVQIDDDQWDRVLDTNLSAAFRLTRSVLRPMMKARYGRIVNVASVVGPRANAGQSNYAAAKAGLIGMTKTIGVEIARRGVTVNAVAPGFLPGSKQEKAGVIRHGAKLVHAFAAATVPRVTVVLRKAFGGAMIAMNSRELGADLVLAWPQAQLGVMGGKQAVDLIHRRAIAAADDPTETRARLAAEYERDQLTAATAAGEGVVDEVVAPTETRGRLAAALQLLDSTNRPLLLNRNIPL